MHRFENAVEQNFEEEIDIDELLFEAAKNNHLNDVNKLLKKGADVNYTNSIYYTPLTIAVENNHVNVVRRLLQVKNIDTTILVSESRDAIGDALAIHIAAFNGYDEIVHLLLTHSRDDIDAYEYCGFTSLHEAILNGNLSTFKLLLNFGASYDLPTEYSDNYGTPGGLDALELIMHELMEENKHYPFELIKMLVHLVKNYEVGQPQRKFFKENLEFYKLVVKNIDYPEDLYKKLLAYFEIPSEQLKLESLNGIFGNFEELSDSDSEDEMDYQYQNKLELHRETVEKKLENNFSTEKESTLVPHFRGVHFYPQYFNRQGRRLERELTDEQAKGALPREPLFCDAAHELAKVPYQLPDSDDVNEFSAHLSERTKKLTSSNEKIISAVQLMQNQKKVEPCLLNSKRENYKSRYHEFVQRYVNSYAALKKDMESAPSVVLDTIKSKVNKEKFTLFKQMGFTKLPFISTTEDDHWAFEYAFSLVCYDKQKTFRPNENSAIKPLQPCYLPNGKPRFPYLGVVYATLHSTTELDDDNSERILDLFAENAIDTRCAAPGGHVTGGYIRAKERIFVNTIDAKRIFVALVVRVPNFDQSYQDYMQEKYGLSENEFNKFKDSLLKAAGSNYMQTTKLRNEQQYFRIQLKIIEKVTAHQEQKLLTFLSSCAENKNFQLKMFGSTTDELIDPCVRDAKEEKAFIKQFVDRRSQSSQSMFNINKRGRDQLSEEKENNEERESKRQKRDT